MQDSRGHLLSLPFHPLHGMVGSSRRLSSQEGLSPWPWLCPPPSWDIQLPWQDPHGKAVETEAEKLCMCLVNTLGFALEDRKELCAGSVLHAQEVVLN